MFRFLRARQARSSLLSHRTTHHMRATDCAVAEALPDTGHLNIPVADVRAGDQIARNTIEQGRTLARQDRWAELSRQMRAADADRAAAPDGTPIADLLAFGARSDVVLAVEHALSDGNALCEYDLLGGISELEDEMREHPDDPMITLVVALTHIDLAWAWRGTATDAALPAAAPVALCGAFRQGRSPVAAMSRSQPQQPPHRCGGLCAFGWSAESQPACCR